MKYIITVLLALSLSGCFWNKKPDSDPTPEKVVWKVPEFTMPDRPTLRSNVNTKTDGEIVRDVELDMFDLSSYAQQLENILKDLKNK